MNKADAVVAVSTPLLQELLALYPWVRNRATVIPNSIDESWFIRPEHPQPSGERYVLFVGRLHAVKGIDLLLRAWSLLQGQLPGVTLVLAGAGKELEKLRALTEQMGISASVCFKGHQTPAALRGLYWGAEAVVLSSRKEGLPRVCLEAGACGAIRVATAVGGVPELIRDGVTGLLVSPDSAEALAQGILHALRLPDTARKRMSAAARENVREQFSQKQMVARYEAVFQAVS